jgi:hypothetical protein
MHIQDRNIKNNVIFDSEIDSIYLCIVETLKTDVK